MLCHKCNADVPLDTKPFQWSVVKIDLRIACEKCIKENVESVRGYLYDWFRCYYCQNKYEKEDHREYEGYPICPDCLKDKK